jgi:hypothetical protein
MTRFFVLMDSRGLFGLAKVWRCEFEKMPSRFTECAETPVNKGVRGRKTAIPAREIGTLTGMGKGDHMNVS